MKTTTRSLFIVWKVFQRRVESLAPEFEAIPMFYHYGWEEKSKFLKALSYIPKFIFTLRDLFQMRPALVFIQLPPTPALYAVALYCWIAGARYVADCHNAMVVGKWFNWPLAKWLLKRSALVLVHNEDIAETAYKKGLSPAILRCPFPPFNLKVNSHNPPQIVGTEQGYVIVPWAFAPDEPLAELFRVAELLPDIAFLLTWFKERLPAHLASVAPANMIFTGYLDVVEFNHRFANATAAVVLTTREGTQPTAIVEATMLEIPLVLSDLETTRKVNKDIPVYVQNNAESIAKGIEEAIRNQDEIKERMRVSKRAIAQEMGKQVMSAKGLLGLPERIAHLHYISEANTTTGTS